MSLIRSSQSEWKVRDSHGKLAVHAAAAPPAPVVQPVAPVPMAAPVWLLLCVRPLQGPTSSSACSSPQPYAAPTPAPALSHTLPTPLQPLSLRSPFPHQLRSLCYPSLHRSRMPPRLQHLTQLPSGSLCIPTTATYERYAVHHRQARLQPPQRGWLRPGSLTRTSCVQPRQTEILRTPDRQQSQPGVACG